MPIWYWLVLMVLAFLGGFAFGRGTSRDPDGIPLIGGDDPEVQPGSIFDGSEVKYADHELPPTDHSGAYLDDAAIRASLEAQVEELRSSGADPADVFGLLVTPGTTLQVDHDPARVWVKEESRAPTSDGPWSEPVILRRIMLGSSVYEPDQWGKPWQQNSGMWIRVRETSVTREVFEAWLKADTERRHQPRAHA